MNYYFIYNPVAGSNNKEEDFIKQINSLMASKKYNIELYKTKEVGDATRYAEEIATNAKEPVTIFACGGDGTMNEVLNGIGENPLVSFGVVPTGSCNDFLKSFPEYDFMDLEAQIEGTTKKIDMMKVEQFYALNVTNIGYDADVNYDQMQLRDKYKDVKKAYNKAIVKNLLKPLGHDVIIKSDDKVLFEGSALLLATGNAKFYGGGFKCCPEAEVDDGILNLVGFKKVSVFTFLRLVKRFKKGEHTKDERFKKVLINHKIKKVTIIGKKTLTICIDGETIHLTEVTIECIPNSLSFVLPKIK